MRIHRSSSNSANCLLVLAALLVVVMLSGCVKTVSKGKYSEEFTEQQVLNQRLQAARSYIAQGNWEDAKRHLKEAAKISKNNPEVFETLAVVMQNTGEFELAEDNFKRALRIDPKYSRGRNNYAAFLYQQERYDEACQQLEKLVEDVLYEKRENAFINLGRCYVETLKLDKAKSAFERALLMDRKNPVIAFELADIHYKLRDYQTAQSYYEAYRKAVRQQSPRALWLGIKLARYRGDRNAEASFGLVLKNLYPESKEYAMYQRLSRT